MGSPISATIANLVMEFLEEKVMETLEYKPTFYNRYVDDCLLCIQQDKIQYVLNHFNDYHRSIQFTMEEKIN